MKMGKPHGSEKSGALKKFLFTLSVTILAWIVSSALYFAGNFYSHLDKFSAASKRGDLAVARAERVYLQNFYGASEKWKVGWLAERFLFRDAKFYDAAYFYLLGDYKKIEEELRDSNDYRAFHILGDAKFRLAYAAYLADPRVRGTSVKTFLEEARADYEQAVKLGPDSNFDDKWNYDLLSRILDGGRDLKSSMALIGQKPSANLLGIEKPGRKDSEGEQPKEKKLNEEKKDPAAPSGRRKG
ncbi:MAG: hypothetical protein Q8P49_02890 [Candidatus Liptonbacteria bacterium]|nr:hypothetical protein [Candidatus Liptonbacteria bacterium]